MRAAGLTALAFPAALPISRTGKPEDVAQMVVFLASDVSNYTTGQAINVDGGWVMD
jgi:NAD(P)-dependent dehydrogenase (short-subunit alcohol dehydrogenase family)